MGIHGLLPLLKSIMTPIDVKDLRGCTVAVDTYSWLHKGALSCSKELCTGQPTSRHIDYCMHRVNLLRHHGIRPVLVFDGGLLPMKNDQEVKRLRARKENLERALEHEAAGNFTVAYECYQKAVDISPAIAFELIQVLKQAHVDFIVAPYEADAQLTFLSLNKLVDAVITEDSDLIPFGCTRIIFKMDKFGQGVEFQYSMLQKNRQLNFSGFTKQMILEMCILSGCDYLPSLPGMGIKKAHALVRKLRSYDKVIKHLKYSAVLVSPSYEESFKKALWTFLYQRVYDPMIDDIVHLTEVPCDVSIDLDFLGPSISTKVARGIARGELDPFSKLPFQEGRICSTNYAVKEFKCESRRKMPDLPAQKNVLTNYFCAVSSEAKMKFKAPRVMEKSDPDSLEESSPDTEGYISNLSCLTEEDSPCTINLTQESWPSPTLLTDHQSSGDSRKKGSEHVVLVKQSCNQRSGPPVSTHPKEDKSLVAKRKVTVRSSYFQHNSSDDTKKENNENQKAVVDGEDRSSPVKAVNIETENAAVLERNFLKRKVIVRSSYFQHNSSDDTERKNNENQDAVVAGEERSSPVKPVSIENANAAVLESKYLRRKGIVRSSYFQHNSSDDMEKENNENQEGVVAGEDKNSTGKPESIETANAAVLESSCLRSALKKRKSFPIQTQNTQGELFTVEHTKVNRIPFKQGDQVPDTCNRAAEPETMQRKFGCNISHLGHFSGISEKSMERFVSVISSFTCVTSGSRASGLRAPLKDVQNTRTNGLSMPPQDFSKFSYAHNKMKRLSRPS